MATTIEWFGKSPSTAYRRVPIGLPMLPYRRHDFQTEDVWAHHLLGYLARTPEHLTQIPRHRGCYRSRLHLHFSCAHRPVSLVSSGLVYLNRMLIFVYSLPGADKIAIKTGAIVVGNGEAINVLRAAGVPEGQLVPVSGGERVPLSPVNYVRLQLMAK
jgi:hypothetical protein